MATNFSPVLGVLSFKAIPKYCNVWYEGILSISQWSDTEPSWPSCYDICKKYIAALMLPNDIILDYSKLHLQTTKKMWRKT